MNQRNIFVPGGTKKIRGGAITLGLAALLLAGCEVPGTDQTTVRTEDVAEDTDALTGEEITVRNVVEETLGENAFLVESDPGDPVIVINATGQPFQLPDPSIPIQSTGIVQTLSIDQIEQQYGLTLDRNVLADYENQPAIIASSLALAPNPETFYESPQGLFENQAIAVEGDVRLFPDVDNAFALMEEGWVNDVGVLVVGVDQYLQGVPIEEGENVAVTGEAQPVSEQLLREYNLGWSDAEIQEFVSRYTNRPVIVADGVYPSAMDPAPGN